MFSYYDTNFGLYIFLANEFKYDKVHTLPVYLKIKNTQNLLEMI